MATLKRMRRSVDFSVNWRSVRREKWAQNILKLVLKLSIMMLKFPG